MISPTYRCPGRVSLPPAPDPAAGWWNDPRAIAVLDAGELVHLAVRSGRGPHVTPLAFQRQAGRLWLVVARDSVKTRAVAGDPAVGVLVRAGAWAVMCAGRARIVDPLTLRGLGPRLLSLPLAVGGYALRNFRPAAAAVRDRPVPTLPLARVLIAVDLTRVALLHGLCVVAAWGSWERRDLLLRGTQPPNRAPEVARVPEALRNLLSDPSQPGVLGWQTLSGPMAIPARWEAERGTLVTSAQAMVLAGGASRSSCCYVVDRGGRRCGPREGLLLCGSGSARLEGQTAHVALGTKRVTWWTGTRTHRGGTA